MPELEQSCGARVELSRASNDDNAIVDVARISCQACGIDQRLGEYVGEPEQVAVFVAEDQSHFLAKNCERPVSVPGSEILPDEDAALRSWSRSLFGSSMVVYSLAAVAHHGGNDFGLSETVATVQNMIGCISDEPEPDVYAGVRNYLERLCPDQLEKVSPGVYRKTSEIWRVLDASAPLLLAEGLERARENT